MGNLLSLYSTRRQTHLHWSKLPVRSLCVTKTNMYIKSKFTLIPHVGHNVDALPTLCQTQAPMREGGIWFTLATFAFGMSISCCLFPFCLPWVPNANVFCGGIWALIVDRSDTSLFHLLSISGHGDWPPSSLRVCREDVRSIELCDR